MAKEQEINYKRIFIDIISQKFPEKKEICKTIAEKKHLSGVDIIEINEKIFGNNAQNQRHRSYTKSDILKILDYQKKHHLNNSELSKHFGISRNTITKWKRIFV
ncbi:helix-turn-helix domain-containing protein [Daejeonia sp. YH14]|uniref:helix-turn-helix domain-containing protein n=1 Tax=Daejeonia sp. YH14 TaxID=3439042 RepID=UPI003F493CCE